MVKVVVDDGPVVAPGVAAKQFVAAGPDSTTLQKRLASWAA
ncbi:MAG: hypothetical protein R2857_09005 [Vampirovibrionales bacterium]